MTLKVQRFSSAWTWSQSNGRVFLVDFFILIFFPESKDQDFFSTSSQIKKHITIWPTSFMGSWGNYLLTSAAPALHMDTPEYTSGLTAAQN